MNDDYAAADAAAPLCFLQRRGVIARPGPLPTPRCESTPLDGVDVLTAPMAGVLVHRKQL
ncbi:MAG: hypothetical protein U1F42_07960 [Candidatus Competibacteraceae bacterium]